MQVTLKIERYDPETDERRLETTRSTWPRRPRCSTSWTCQGRGRRLADVPQVLPHGGLRLVRHADGRRRRAGLQDADGAAGRGRATSPTISPMGNLPVIKDLVVDMDPFWDKFKAVKPYLDDDDGDAPVKEWRVQQEELDRIMKEALCIQCGCCVSECNSMAADPDFLGPAALAKAAAVRRRRPRPRRQAAAGALQRPTRRLGLHPLLLLQRALPEGRRPARRDRQARRRDLPGGHALGQGRPPREGVRHVDATRPATCSRRAWCPTPTR